MGYRVELAWKSLRMIEPSEVVDEDDICFWWSSLPVADILANETRIDELLFDTASLSFPMKNSSAFGRTSVWKPILSSNFRNVLSRIFKSYSLPPLEESEGLNADVDWSFIEKIQNDIDAVISF